MAWELVYTSAPRGLADGSGGFCTVAATAGMPASLIARIEALSGYRPAFGAQAPADAVHPVQNTHVRLDHAGQSLSVLSRIVHVGHDYSGRTNKLAHHLVLEPDEQRANAAGNPAAWIRGFDGWRDRWDDEPRNLEPRSLAPLASAATPPCRAWAAAAGDAGYAGRLAERFLLDPSRPTSLLHDPARHDALALLDEAAQLLPPETRWRVTFATYFTDPLPESGVVWRGLVAGTRAATSASAAGASEVVNLLEALPRLGPTRYVDLARGDTAAVSPPTAGKRGGAPSQGAGASSASARKVARPYELATNSASVELPGAAAERAPATEPASAASARPRPVPKPSRSVPARAAAAPQTPAAPAGASHATVPLAWFLAALVGWPLLIGAVAWWAWPDAPAAPAPAAEEVSAGNAGNAGDAGDRGDAVAAATVAAAAAPVAAPSPPVAAEGRTPGREITVGEESKASADPPAEAPAERPQSREALPEAQATAPVRTLVSAAPTRTLWPERISADLPAARLRSSGAAGVGALATLEPAQASLTAAAVEPGFAKVSTVQLRPALLASTARLGLRWRPTSLGAALLIDQRDAFGGSRPVEIGRAAWEADGAAGSGSGSGLIWRWLPTPLQRAHADDLAEIEAEAALSVWELRGAQGEPLSRVQGRPPATREVRMDADADAGSSLFSEAQGESLGSLGVGALALTLEAPPSPWSWSSAPSAASSPPARQLLEGPGGAELRLELRPGPRNVARFYARWQAAPEAVATEIQGLDAELQADRAWLAEWTKTDAEHRERVAALPRNSAGEVDETKRLHPKHRADFSEADNLRERRQNLREAQPLEPESLPGSLVERESRLVTLQTRFDAMTAFPGCRVVVSLASSGARLVELEVRP